MVKKATEDPDQKVVQIIFNILFNNSNNQLLLLSIHNSNKKILLFVKIHKINSRNSNINNNKKSKFISINKHNNNQLSYKVYFRF